MSEKQPVYIPVMMDEPLDITRLKRRIAIALQDTPDAVCGIAYRIGRIVTEDGDQALYRLRLSMGHANYGTNTLPGIYMLKDGKFVEYESKAI